MAGENFSGMPHLICACTVASGIYIYIGAHFSIIRGHGQNFAHALHAQIQYLSLVIPTL